uniref:Activating transcription factor 1 [Anas platyrhynchos] n=1 Tax=Lepeophtheirus salmonis TaxID=72036 RepID=A0A0K2UCU4_LEPSM
MNNNKSKVKTSSDLSSHLNRKKRRKIMSSSSASSVVTKQEEPDVVEHTVIEEEEVVEESPGPKEVQYVVIDKTGETGGGRGVLSRQPSYCKILKDLKEVEEDVVMKGGEQQTETIEVTTSEAPVQTITINGQQYQIVSPAALNESSSSVVQYAATANSNGQTVFIPGTLSNNSSSNNSSSSQVMTVSPNASSHNSAAEDASRKREIRLLKNREAARECRNKKKEYIRCLENRVAVLENQNKALIEELKSLKELYTGQKN